MRQVLLYPDLQDGGYVAEVPSLPGCISQGDTKAEAIANIRAAITLWVATARRLKLKVPKDALDAQVCVV